jgi:hypothetical protein
LDTISVLQLETGQVAYRHSIRNTGTNMSVRLPNHLVGDSPEYLKDLPLGATWHFAFWDMWVDIDRTCYLDPAAKRCPPGAFYKIQVKRDAAGYHVVIEDPRIRYVPRAISSTTALIPVASLTEQYGDMSES